MISNFSFIGFPDLTFEKEYKAPLKTEPDELEDSENLKYPDYKYTYNISPTCIYIPSDLVLLKIMRACCFITKIEDLVYYIESCCA